MILGLGTDLVEIEKMGENLRSPGFVERVFTPAETLACRAVKNSAQAFAGKFAAKEACMKALHAGIRQEVWFTDIEVLDGLAGEPHITLSARLPDLLSLPDAMEIHVSISHSGRYATAVVIIEQKTSGL